MQKLFIKKREKRVKKWTSVRDIENNRYSDAHLKRKKRDEQDNPCSLAKMFPSLKREISFQGAK